MNPSMIPWHQPIISILLCGLSLTSAHAEEPAPATADAGFVSLFNGKDWEGWDLKIKNGDPELAKKVFAIGDGMIHVFRDLPDRYALDSGTYDTHGMIYTKKKYSRFIFRFEYKWGKKICNNFGTYQYDAGCYYHVFDDRIWPKGIEYQVRYDHEKDLNHTGDFWASGATFQWYAGKDGTFLLPNEGGKSQPIKGGEHLASSKAEHHALDGKWNRCEVIVMGREYAIHKLNGKIVNMATGLSVGDGLVGLQAETAEIFYRNIAIKEFADAVPMEEFLR